MNSAMDEPDQALSISSDTVARARPDVSSVELDGEIVLYDDATHRLHRLNPTAATVWQCLDGSGTLREIAADIASVYEVEVARVLPEVVSLTRSFAVEGLLEGAQTPHGGSEDGRILEPSGETGPFIAEAPTPCMDPKFTLGDNGNMTVRVGEHMLGLRVSTATLSQVARSVLAPSLVGSVTAPPNVSVVETTAGVGRPIYFCYRSGWLVDRSRSLRRALWSAAMLLSTYGETAGAQLVRVHSLVAVRDGQATLFFPESRNLFAGMASRLEAGGWRVSSLPWALLRPGAGAVVIPPLAFEIDKDALGALPFDSRETPPPDPGEYPVAAWVCASLYGMDTSTLAGRITQVAQGSPDLKHDAPLVFDTIRKMLQRAAWKVGEAFDAASLVRSANA